ncbi:centrosomal protein of 290 kDa-like [Amphiura filiformis]|uniref:centrosomal protein of 290 kDa-like n=1 Tax=Amphiura filiformis TaxID=82378 RepID=UPI003B2269AA
MAPVDWGKVMAVDAANIGEDEADELTNMLADLDPPGGASEEQMLQLFELARTVMQVKATQASVAFEEMEKMAESQGQEGVKNEQALLDQIKDLNEDNKRLQRLGAAGGNRDIRSLQNEISELSRQNDLLERELKDKEREVNKERRDSERFAQRAEDAEKETRELKRENDTLRQDLRDYQHQMESQREHLLQRRGDDMDSADRMRQKNRELNDQLEELQNLTDANERLQRQCAELTGRLEQAANEMEEMSEAHSKVKVVLQQSDTYTQNIQQENEVLKEQIRDLTDQIRGRSVADDDIMEALNKKVEEWKELLAAKDIDIEALNHVIEQQKEQITGLQMDTERTSIVALTQALQEKEQQLEALRKQLELSAEEMEAQAAELEEIKNAAKGGAAASTVRLQSTIKQLKDTLKEQEKDHKMDGERTQLAERDARDKDKQLSEALTRMREYETGVYGLTEAVHEIKECKKQIAMRDRNVEKLTQNVNRLELQLNDMLEENEELRSRLGLDPKEPIDLVELRNTKTFQNQQDRAMNQILNQEVERLEAERLELKKIIRSLATKRAQRAVALGLDADDMVALDEFTEELKAKKKGGPGTLLADTVSKLGGKDIGPSDSFRVKASQMEKELNRAEQISERFRTQVADLDARNKQLVKENEQMEQSMKQILQALKESTSKPGGDSIGDSNLQPTLERLCLILEAKSSGGSVEAQLYLKAQVDQLTGRNEELRRELRHARNEYEKAKVELDRAALKVQRLDQDLQALRDAGQGAVTLHQMTLPKDMAASSAEVISSLNQQLIHALQELSNKEEQLGRCENSLIVYRRKFAVIRHQQGLVYQEYKQKEEEWEKARETLEQDKTKLSDQIGQQEARVQEFNRLLDTLQQSGDEHQRRISDSTRKITVLRVNEKALTRRYTSSQEMEGTLRKEVNKLRNEMVQMETAITERLGYLQRHKEASQFKIAALQRALDESVPSAELEAANRQYNELAAKYRDLLQTDNQLVSRNTQIDTLESENKRLEEEAVTLKREFATEKEKLHTLEQAVEEMGKLEGALGRGSKGVATSDHLSLAKRLTTIEMKEMNERQRAEHAVRMQEKLRNTVSELETRNLELEQKFAELTRLNLEMQKTESELRDELSICVTKAASDMDKKRIAELEKNEATIKLENDKLKEIVEVASFQTRALESQQVSREKEVMSLRQQLMDIQTQSDEKAIIGKLHHHIVALQVSEGTAVRKLQAANTKVKKLEAHALRLQKQVDEKSQSLYHCQVAARNKARHLKATIQELRRQFSGAVPLGDQEKFSKAMLQLKQDKERMESQVKVLKYEREKVADQLSELELKHHGLQELIQTLQDGKGAAKVAEWHSKMQDTRLQHLKLSRKINRLQEQTKYAEGLVTNHERSISNLEQDNVRIARESEERQLLWEQREVELERIIDSLERQQREMADAALRFEEATGSLPDPSMPVASQLEHAIRTIKQHIKTILDNRAEQKTLQKKLDDTEAALKQVEDNLLQRDKVINELRLRLPASSERDEIIKDTMAQGVRFKAIEETCEHRQALKVAQTQIEGLQTRIQQKEDALQKYVELLDKAREESAEENKKHLEEMHRLQLTLHTQSDAAFSKFKKAAMDLTNKQAPAGPTNKQLLRLQELEDLVAQQDNSMAAMSIKLKAANTETQKWKQVLERKAREFKQNREKLVENHNAEVARLKGEISECKAVIEEKQAQIKELETDLAIQKGANARAPTSTMKNLVERLKNELALKEQQHKSLSQALLQLRAEMVDTAQQNVKANAEEQEQQINVQKLLDRETKHLREQLDENRGKLDSARKELKKHKNQTSALSKELQEVKDDLSKKSAAVEKLKQDREKLQEQLERQGGGASSKKQPDGDQPEEVEELQHQISTLKRQLERAKKSAGNDGKGQTDTAKKEQSAIEVARWEESKKWEKKVESLKNKLKDKDKEIEQLQKTNKMLKDALNRTERLKGMQQPTKPDSFNTTKRPSPPSNPQNEQLIQELKKKNHDLQEEVVSLRREQALGQDGDMSEVRRRNEQLTEKIDLMEREMARRLAAKQQSSGSSSDSADTQKQADLECQIFQLSQENIELRFDAEQAKSDLPRLRQRIRDLEGYNEALKADLERERERARSRPNSAASSLRRSGGSSGKSVPELERTIGLMKKVVERVQKENDELKKAPGVTTQTEIHQLRDENKDLKAELETLQHQMGGQLSMRYESTQKGIAKVRSENERLRQDLKREVESAEKLRVSHSHSLHEKDKLQRQLQEFQEKLEIDKARGVKLETADSKSWKSIVVTRMYEEKMRTLEQDMEKKNSTIIDMKQLLRDSAQREQSLLRQVGELGQKVAILERFPSDSITSDSDLVRELQQTRLTLNRVENEKAELLNELKLFRMQGNVPASATDLMDGDLGGKLHDYNQLMTENVEIRTDMKTMQLDHERLKREYEKLRKELEQFDPAFFEEIEDLKFNYREAVQRNVQYEEQLRQLSQQFGVSVNVPPL